MHHHAFQNEAMGRSHLLMDLDTRRHRQDVGRLVAEARLALNSDIGAARNCLDQLSHLIERSSTDLNFDPPTSAIAAVKGGLACWQIRLIGKHIDDNVGSTIPISALSEIARLSVGHFCRAFKISTGDTPHTYILRRRIEHAQRRMLTTENSLSQIACECGMADQAHLTRLFRKFVGQTPLLWRRTWQRNLA